VACIGIVELFALQGFPWPQGKSEKVKVVNLGPDALLQKAAQTGNWKDYSMTDFIAYYRVSTDKQGVSGLGLGAQREAVARYLGSTGQLLGEYTEVESGKHHSNRPQLKAALDECRKRRVTLLIASLDRLARNVHFISGLMESAVPFVAADMPTAAPFEIHIRAAMAEEERRKISQRTKAALQQVKADIAKKGQRTSRVGRVFTTLAAPSAPDHGAEAYAPAVLAACPNGKHGTVHARSFPPVQPPASRSPETGERSPEAREASA
jgi:DNA invertase Pin-like site-specific DNA recombinase